MVVSNRIVEMIGTWVAILGSLDMLSRPRSCRPMNCGILLPIEIHGCADDTTMAAASITDLATHRPAIVIRNDQDFLRYSSNSQALTMLGVTTESLSTVRHCLKQTTHGRTSIPGFLLSSAYELVPGINPGSMTAALDGYVTISIPLAL